MHGRVALAVHFVGEVEIVLGHQPYHVTVVRFDGGMHHCVAVVVPVKTGGNTQQGFDAIRVAPGRSKKQGSFNGRLVDAAKGTVLPSFVDKVFNGVSIAVGGGSGQGIDHHRF